MPEYDLFSYPARPGYRRQSTSKAAADHIAPAASRLRDQVLQRIRNASDGMTADEAAAAMGMPITTIRPRLTELKIHNEITDTGKRRKNESGRNAIVWRAA